MQTKIQVPYNEKTARAYELVYDLVISLMKVGEEKTSEFAATLGNYKTVKTAYKDNEYLRTVVLLDNYCEITIAYNYRNKESEIKQVLQNKIPTLC